MKRETVVSSNLVSVGYDPAKRILEIEFTNRRIYQYFGIPVSVYQALMKAPSQGKYFHKHIRDKYPTKQIL